MINLKEIPIFSKHIGTLMELSKDTAHNEYMTESQIEAINFDDVKTEYTNSLNLSEETASSVDALVKTKCLYFMEFKNGVMRGEIKKVKDKIRDSLLIFCDIANMHISETRKLLDFILVYNEEKNSKSHQKQKPIVIEDDSRVSIGKHFANKAHDEFILFGLENFKKLYFKEVHTYNKKEFEKFLKNCFASN